MIFLDLTEPGVLCRLGTTTDFVSKCVKAGLVWVAPQTWNEGSQPQSTSMALIQESGLAAPVWGVSYETGDFAFDGTGLAISAEFADGAIIDAEVVLDNADPEPLWAALDAYTGPKALSCEANGTDPDKWPLPVHVEGAVARGYVFQPQAYFNAADFLTPANAILEWMGHGVPREKIAVCISLAASESDKPKPNNRMSFAEQVPVLEAASVGRHFSIFADTDITDQDFSDIAAYLARYPKEIDVDKQIARAAVANFLASTIGSKAMQTWRDANPREYDRWAGGDYDQSHYSTKFGKFAAGIEKAIAA